MSDLVLSRVVAAHLAYHARMAAGFAAAGDLDECASESLLVSMILTIHGAREADGWVTSDLPERAVTHTDAATATTVRRRAHALALELQAHFVSEGQTESAALYEALATELHQR